MHVYQTAAGAGKRVQALTEAKNHALVLEDCVLERTVRGIVNSTYGCAGQRCMALPVVCVQESIADEFVAMLRKFAQELKVGAGLSARSRSSGRWCRPAQKEWVEKCIARGVAEGAELVLDGRGVKVPGYEGGYFVGPTIFDHVKPGTSSATRKSSARSPAIKRVKDFEEGLAIMNANRFANGSCIYTSSGPPTRASSPVAPTAAWSGSTSAFRCRSRSSRSAATSNRSSATCIRSARTASPSSPRPSRVTSVWFTEEDAKKAVSTWDGTLTRG